jgi:hypothetical protein
MDHSLFLVQEAGLAPDGLPFYQGTGLHGQTVRTCAPSVLHPDDEVKLNQLLGE